MDEEDQTEDIKALDSFLNPKAPDSEGEEEEEEGKEKKSKPDKPVEAAKGQSFTAGLKARAAKLPTPGSIAFPLLAVLVIIFFVTPVGGKTRAVHLWNVLIGKEALSTDYVTSNTPTAGATQPATGSGEYQDNIITFNPKASQFQMIEEGNA